jgi:uncharacterized protein YceK
MAHGGRLLRVAFLAGCVLLVLVGCSTISGATQSCESNFGVLDAKEVECSGSVESMSGSPSLEIIDVGGRLDGAFLLEATMKVGQGTAGAYVTDTDDTKVGGELSPDAPLRIRATVYPEESEDADDDNEVVELQLEIPEEKEVNNLRYEATLVQQD